RRVFMGTGLCRWLHPRRQAALGKNSAPRDSRRCFALRPPIRGTSVPPIMVKPALGKGLSALINPRVASPTPSVEAGERIQTVPIDQIIPSPWQPRTDFRDENIQELAESIREKGVIQPLIVRRAGEKFELVAGERRWRAAQRVGLKDAPVIVREASDQDVLEL